MATDQWQPLSVAGWIGEGVKWLGLVVAALVGLALGIGAVAAIIGGLVRVGWWVFRTASGL